MKDKKSTRLRIKSAVNIPRSITDNMKMVQELANNDPSAAGPSSSLATASNGITLLK